MADIIAMLKRMQSIIQMNDEFEKLLTEFCVAIHQSIPCNVVLLDKSGRIVASAFLPDDNFIFNLKETLDGNLFENIFDQFKNILEPMTNVTLQMQNKNYNTSVYPIRAKSKRLGVLFLYKLNEKFTTEELIQSEVCATLFFLIFRDIFPRYGFTDLPRSNTIKSAMDSLSYSEMEAVVKIFEELDSREGVIVASKIAGKVGVTRSVIVTALRKLESAGIIESRSLGMKGTHIKVLNSALLEELKKV